MRFKVFCVYDSKAKAFSSVQNYRSTEEAKRAFTLACQQEDSNWYLYAEDYSLFEIGDYDDETGLHEPYQVPVMILQAIQASKNHSEYYSKVGMLS